MGKVFSCFTGQIFNMLGPANLRAYGYETLAEIKSAPFRTALQLAGHSSVHLQSNAEHEFNERIHAAKAEGVDYILV